MNEIKVSIADVLNAWRPSICFGDAVRIITGEKGAVCGKVPSGFLLVILDDRHAEPRKREAAAATLYPGWWPEAWWSKDNPGDERRSEG